jgi:hypothetical protein
MPTPLRRLAVVLLVAAVGAALLAWLRGRSSAEAPLEAPAWPPLEPATGDEPPDDPGPADPAGSAWVPPAEDGSCPDGYPIKAKSSSGIFHVPEGRSYARTRAERCYASAEAAIADGYRQAKS